MTEKIIHIARPALGQEEKDAVRAVLDSGMIASGDIVTQFENMFAAHMGARTGLACSSGTTALELALRALGIGHGDKVLTTSFSFIASTNCIISVGATPVFTDIDEETFLMTPELVKTALDKHPDIKAILPVHLFGQACDMEGLMVIARRHGLMVIEDCAQSHDATYKGRKTGSFGDAACFSFYPTKNMTTSEGGMILFKDPDADEKARMLVNHGMRERYYHKLIGYNYRMTNIAAAIGIEQLKKLPAFNEARKKNAAWLSKTINNPLVSTPKIQEECEHVFNQYTIKVAQREELMNYLATNAIGCAVFYPRSIPEQECYTTMGFEYDINSLTSVEKVKKQVLSLPVHPLLTTDELVRIACAVNSFPEGET